MNNPIIKGITMQSLKIVCVALIVGLIVSQCASNSNLSTAHPLGKGETRVTIGLSKTTTKSDTIPLSLPAACCRFPSEEKSGTLSKAIIFTILNGNGTRFKAERLSFFRLISVFNLFSLNIIEKAFNSNDFLLLFLRP